MKLWHIAAAGAAVYTGLWFYNQRAAGTAPTASGLINSAQSDLASAISTFVPKGASIAPGPAVAPVSSPSQVNGDGTTRLMIDIGRPFYPGNPYPTQLATGRGPVPVVLTRADRIRAGAIY